MPDHAKIVRPDDNNKLCAEPFLNLFHKVLRIDRFKAIGQKKFRILETVLRKFLDLSCFSSFAVDLARYACESLQAAERELVRSRG